MRLSSHKHFDARPFLWLVVIIGIFNIDATGQQIPDGFEVVKVMEGLQDPASFAFSPDGRLFYGERITGKLKVANWDTTTKMYIKEVTPFYQFGVPAERHRSSGLRGFTFDPNYGENGFIYAFYMRDNPRHNQVVRIQANPAEADIAIGGETILMELPFSSSNSSGSHNGGDLIFGTDDKLYFTTGDGWNGGDDVQSLYTYTGKVMRINRDGSIPSDNPFYNDAAGDLKAIYALGLRNPYSVSNLSPTGQIYINDAVGPDKGSVYQLTPGANFGHDGYDGIGTETDLWANMSVSDAIVISGGLWYPSGGYWPSMYHGNYFAAFWGSNSNNAPGAITRAVSESDNAKSMFYDNILLPGGLKPVMLKLGPDGDIYYMMTDYETGVGEIYKIEYTGELRAKAPVFTPEAGQYPDSIYVAMSTELSFADIYYTLDNSQPDNTSSLYVSPILVDSTITINAIAYEVGKSPSSISNAKYSIGAINNLPPEANAGPDLIVSKDREVTLNGSDSFDPDGSQLEMQEHWKQIGGSPVDIFDADETVANFTPLDSGLYVFKIVVEDIYGEKDSDNVIITVLPFIDDYLDDLIARWSLEEGEDAIAEDTSPNSYTGQTMNTSWSMETGDSSRFSVRFDNANDRVEIEDLDVTGEQMTICFWTKLSTYSQSDARFISKASGQNNDDHYWMVSTLNDSQLRFRLQTNNGGTATLVSDVGVLPLSKWCFIAATYDGVQMKIYKDGLLLDSLSKTGLIATNPNINVCLGNQPLSATGGARPLNGLLDEMRIYGKALTLSEINQVYQAKRHLLCLNNLLIALAIPGIEKYKVNFQLQSSGSFTTPKKILFQAGESIELIPPFTIEMGASLLGQIAKCHD